MQESNSTNQNSLDLLTIGDVCIDLYMKVDNAEIENHTDPEHPRICFNHGSKIPVQSVKSNIAGNAVNVSIGAQMMGLKTAIYAEMGNDEEALRIENELKEAGIATDYLVKNEGTTTGIHPVIMYGGDRTIFSHHEKIDYKLQDWPKSRWIYYTSLSPGFESFQEDLVDYLKQNPQIGTAFNPGTFQIRSGVDGLKNMLEVTHVLFVNKEEAELFVGKGNVEDLHTKLQALGPKLTVITEGDNGATGHDGTNLVKVEAFPIDKPILDKTGAGDSFACGVLCALFYGKTLQEALTWGAINSSSVIREVGAVHGLQTKSQMEDLAAN